MEDEINGCLNQYCPYYKIVYRLKKRIEELEAMKSIPWEEEFLPEQLKEILGEEK